MQLALPGADPAAFLRGDDDPLVAEFLARHDAAPAVFEAFARFARQALAAGRTRIGAKMIAERIRWESFVAGAADYKINNSDVALMALMLAREDARFARAFAFRASRADRRAA